MKQVIIVKMIDLIKDVIVFKEEIIIMNHHLKKSIKMIKKKICIIMIIVEEISNIKIEIKIEIVMIIEIKMIEIITWIEDNFMIKIKDLMIVMDTMKEGILIDNREIIITIITITITEVNNSTIASNGIIIDQDQIPKTVIEKDPDHGPKIEREIVVITIN